MKIRFTILFLFIFAVLASGQNENSQMKITGSPENTTVIKVDPASQNVSNLSLFSSNIMIVDVVNLGSFSLQLNFDPTILQVTGNPVLGTFLGSTGRFVFPLANTYSNTNGTISFGVSTLGPTPPGPNGSGVLISINWQSVGYGTSSIIISDAIITQPNGTVINAILQNGIVAVNPPSYTITTTSNPPAGGITTGGGTYTQGTEVTISANEAQDWLFENWTEATTVISEEAEYSFVVEGDRDFTANFMVDPFYTDSLILVEFYNATNGSNWTNNTNWFTGPLNNWQGITIQNGRVTKIYLMYDDNRTGTIPESFGNLDALKVLNLRQNQISGSIPESMGNLSSLEELWLYHNQFTGTIPHQLGSLNNLKILHLGDNQLSGSIPETIGNLSNLEKLTLWGNQLSGNIPESLGDLSNLEELYLNHNQLSGGIPLSIFNLVGLKALSLYNNQLSGVIHPTLVNMVGLETLYLNSNQFTGIIPENLGSLNSLKYLSLNGNQLTGIIPESLYNLSNLESLQLGQNQLTGDISESIGNISGLRILGLSNNQITGNIPQCLGSLTNLEWVFLSYNQLTGSIPGDLGNLNFMTNFDLSNNQLTGNIPSSLTGLSNLSTLKLNNNLLEGQIPNSICTGLPNMNTLQLNYNNFGQENCAVIQCLKDRGLDTLEHSPQNNGFAFMEDCIPPCEDASANAGDDTSICEDESLQLNGQAENYTSLLWETTGDGTFEDETNLQTIYFPGTNDIANGTVTICLHAYAEVGCEDATDCMQIFIQQSPSVNAGLDETICETDIFQPCCAMGSDFSMLEWSTNGDGYFFDPNILTPEYSPGQNDIFSGTVVLTLIASPIAPCTVMALDELILTIEMLPLVVIGEDHTICEDETVFFAGVIPGADCYLTKDGIPFYDDVYTPTPGDIQNGSVEFCLHCQGNPPCDTEVSDCMTVFIQQLPEIISFEPPVLDCEYFNGENGWMEWLPIPIMIDANNYSSIELSTSGDGFFDDPYTNFTYYNIGMEDQCFGQVELTVKLYGAPECNGFVEESITMIIPMQVITIPLGVTWTGMSSYIDLENVPVPDVVFPLVLVPGSQSLITIEDIDGNYYDAESGINTLGNWQPIGYKAKFKEEGCLPIYGSKLDHQVFTIQGSTTYLPVLTDHPVNIDDLFAGHIDDIMVIYDIQTNEIWTPNAAGFTELIPGRAYTLQQVNGNVAYDIEYPPYDMNCGTAPDHYTISGYVYEESNGESYQPIEHVTVTFSGSGQTITNENGYYEMELPALWSGTVIPGKDGWMFDPVERTYQQLSYYKINQNFSGSPVEPIITVNPKMLDFGEVAHDDCATLDYQLSASYLSDDIIVSATDGFLVSVSENSGFSPTLNIPFGTGEVDQTIYVKYCCPSTNNSGVISNATNGVDAQNVDVTGTCTSAVCEPYWQLVSNLQFNMQVIGQIIIEDELSLNPNDLVGAFVNGECRGIGSPSAANGLVFLTIGSNSMSGETIDFIVWKSDVCEECELSATLQFENQQLIGTPDNPFEFNCGLCVLDLEFGQGFTWFSVNVNPDDMTPNNLFADLSPCQNNRVIGQSDFAIYFGGSWIGSLTELNPDEMYKMELCSQQSITIEGNCVNISPILLDPGFTWLGYPPQECFGVSEAMNLDPLPAINNRLIGQNSFSIFFNGTWIGDLTALCPGQGYTIELTDGGILNYPGSSGKIALSDYKTGSNLKSEIVPASNLQHNMNIIAYLQLQNGRVSLSADDAIYAFSGNECRGMANPDPELDGLIFLTVGSNSESGEPITFSAWIAESETMVDINESVLFGANSLKGFPNEPFLFTIDEITGVSIELSNHFIGEPFPNPFNLKTEIPYAVAKPAEVTFELFNGLGQKVYSKVISHSQKGNYTFLLENEGYYPGVYYYNMSISGINEQLEKRGKLIIN